MHDLSRPRAAPSSTSTAPAPTMRRTPPGQTAPNPWEARVRQVAALLGETTGHCRTCRTLFRLADGTVPQHRSRTRRGTCPGGEQPPLKAVRRA